MQQPSRALKRVLSAFARPSIGWATAFVVMCLSGCGASWSGAWGGTADLGPVNAHALILTLSDKDSTVALTDAQGITKTLTVCARDVVDRKITLVVDTARPDCSKGKDARRLRLEGLIGAGVIHGDLFRGQQRVGFFRAFRAPAPDAPQGIRPTPKGPTGSIVTPTPSAAK